MRFKTYSSDVSLSVGQMKIKTFARLVLLTLIVEILLNPHLFRCRTTGSTLFGTRFCRISEVALSRKEIDLRVYWYAVGVRENPVL